MSTDSGNVIPKPTDKLTRLWAVYDKLEARFDKLHEVTPLEEKNIYSICKVASQMAYSIQTLTAVEKTEKLSKEIERIAKVIDNVPTELIAKYNPEIYARQPRNNPKQAKG